MKVNIHKILKQTKVEGPKNRYCIWFQGCSKRCKGCWAKATWDSNAGKQYNLDELLADISKTPNIDGITILGGEPFEQSEALEYLCQNVQKMNLSVVCFTGNKIDNLKEKYASILKNIDLLIDGEFIEEEKDYSRPWVGSKNQNYHFLSKKFDKSILKEYKNKII